MPRVKNTARKLPLLPSSKKAHVLKKIKKAAEAANTIMKGSGGLVHTGKLKVPFKPAGKKGLIKQLKRRWKSGTVAKREIRKLSRTTHLLFPKQPFQRMVREIAQDFGPDFRFKRTAIQALQEAAEIFVTETFHKADMARKHASRKTLHVQDIRFSRFMTQVSVCICVPKNAHADVM
jgi:histone H3